MTAFQNESKAIHNLETLNNATNIVKESRISSITILLNVTKILAENIANI